MFSLSRGKKLLNVSFMLMGHTCNVVGDTFIKRRIVDPINWFNPAPISGPPLL
jgi:hypothetical protein